MSASDRGVESSTRPQEEGQADQSAAASESSGDALDVTDDPEAPTTTVTQEIEALRAEIQTSVREEIAQSESEYTEPHLTAQQQMASGTIVMAVAAVFTLAVSIYVAVIIRKTLEATAAAADYAKMMADEATKATTAAVDAAKASVEATKEMVHQNELTERSQRPWLSFEIEPYVMKAGDELALYAKLRIANYGASPAHDVSAAAAGHYYASGGDLAYSHMDDKRHTTRVLEAGRSLSETLAVFPSQEMTTSVYIPIVDHNGALEEAETPICNFTVGLCYKYGNGFGWTYRTYGFSGEPNPTDELVDETRPNAFVLENAFVTSTTEAS